MDVRFSDAISFSRFLTETVRDTLRGREMIPEASLSTERERKAERKAEKEASPAAAPEPFEQRRSQAYRVMEEERYAAGQPGTRDFTRNPVWSRVREESAAGSAVLSPGAPEEKKLPDGSEGKRFPGGPAGKKLSEGPEGKRFPDRPEGKKPLDKPEEKKLSDGPADNPMEEEDFFIETTEIPEDTEEKRDEIPSPLADFGNISGQDAEEPEKDPESGSDTGIRNDIGIHNDTVTDGSQLNLFEDKILTVENRSRFRIIGQVFETYWLVEFEDKLLVIDQHAAHEKVHYERMMKRYREKNILSQGLFPPVIVSLSGQEETVLKEHGETFAALGFEIEEFGGSEYALRSVPVDLYGCNEKEMFLEVLNELLEGTGSGTIHVIEEKIASMSCKAAVKGNHRLSTAEAEALIDELLTLDNPYHCPHGRPTIVTMTKTEMERKFKRIV
ncbi:MAG: hypothetical protein HFH87_08925 [Lachnospiraceae bacterium]|nr:hypothetical protein [Lachnospiraceae bacterium]